MDTLHSVNNNLNKSDIIDDCKCQVSCALGPVSAKVLSFDTRPNLGAHVFLSLVTSTFIFCMRICLT